jgi:hypothetical protein
MSPGFAELQPLSLNQKAKKIYMLKAIGFNPTIYAPGLTDF